MKSKTIKVSLRVIVLFTVAILISKIPDIYPDFFGDWLCKGRWFNEKNGLYGNWEGCDVFSAHNPTFHWGYQHYLFFLMGLCLGVLQIIDIVNIYITKTDK